MQRVFDCRDPTQRDLPLTTAVQRLRRGRLAAVPDEAMYLLVADAFSRSAIPRIRALKGRSDAPLTVLVGAPGTVDGIAAGIPPYARDLMAACWPGPLTLVLRQQPSLAWQLGGTRIGVRMPLHPVALTLARELGPLASTSLNRPGLDPARDADDAFDQFDRDVDIYLDAGPSPLSTRSTVIDASGAVAALIRPGAVSPERVEAITGELELRS